MFSSDTNCERFLVSFRLLFPSRPADQSPRIQRGSIGEQPRRDQICWTGQTRRNLVVLWDYMLMVLVNNSTPAT
jgi:hypothetical protein